MNKYLFKLKVALITMFAVISLSDLWKEIRRKDDFGLQQNLKNYPKPQLPVL